MQKFDDLSKWKKLEKGHEINFERSVPIRLEVSTPANSNWFYQEPGADHGVFLANTTGKDVLAFTPEKGAMICCENDCRYKSAQNVFMKVEHSGEATFTVPYEPAERHPELERIAQIAATRAFQRAEVTHAEKERRMQRRIRALQEQNNAADQQQRADQAQPAATPDGNSGAPAPRPQSDNPADPVRQDTGTPPVGIPDNGEGEGREPQDS